MTFIKEHKLFVSSEGAEIDQTFIRSACGMTANATDDHDRQKRSYPNSFGGQHENAGWEMVGHWDLPGNAQRIAEESVQLLKAPQCPHGVGTVIIGASQLGLQIHESCGHPSELDRALGTRDQLCRGQFPHSRSARSSQVRITNRKSGRRRHRP